MKNPLLENFKDRDGSVPFNKIEESHFLPAINTAIAEARGNVKKIVENSEPATFENVIEALEVSSEELQNVNQVFSNLLGAKNSDALQKLAPEIQPAIAALSNEILLDGVLFDKVKTVYQSKSDLSLNDEQSELLEKTYRDFVRNGALLDTEKKERLKEIDERLANLTPQFSENLLKSSNGFKMVIEKEEDLSGLPESLRTAAAEEAKNQSLEGKWVFNLQYPSFVPFLKYSDSAAHRETIWKAYSSRAMEKEADNRPLTIEISALRHERAKLLGFHSHADYVLQERMAESADRVYSFLEKLREKATPAEKQEFEELLQFAKETDQVDSLKPWDVAYYSEKLREKKYAFNEEELRPYFPLDRVVEGAFQTANKLYGLNFQKIDDVPVYHPDVNVYEVTDEADGSYIGLFYTDFFPRESKRSGAWMTQFRSQGLYQGEVRRPHVSIVCNFSKPSAKTPSLLNMNEVRTLFHEFGHALHGLLSKCHYMRLASPNVYWDFVELPSQVMENWVLEKEGLSFAKHYETGEPLPDHFIEKIRESAKFQNGMMTIRQLKFGLLDMAWHSQPDREVKDVEQFEIETLKDLQLLEHVEGTAISPGFAHIFAGGYSAGYYSYKWAEVLDADAFEYFKESGIFNKEVAKNFRVEVLEKGGNGHPMELYKNFRGREPDPDALLRRDGLL